MITLTMCGQTMEQYLTQIRWENILFIECTITIKRYFD